MPISNRKVRIFYVIATIWGIVCLLLTERVSYAIFRSDGVAHLTGVWLVLSLGPIVPALWLWIMERSPWDRLFLVPVAAIGTFLFLAAITYSGSRYYRDDFNVVAFIAATWSVLACFNAWLLKGATRVDALNWKRTKPIPATSVVIDHDKYLRLLSDQEISGFPSIMRVQHHFAATLPECVPAFTDYGPIPDQDEMTEQLMHARKFMLGKVSCELTFLCAISFLERMCGPDFRYTKQYRSLVERMVEIDAVPEDGPFKGLSRKAVAVSDLDGVVSELDKHRERTLVRNGMRGPDSDVTIALAAMTLLVKEGLLQPNTEGEDFNSNFTRMVKGGMNKMRESFSRQKTEMRFPS